MSPLFALLLIAGEPRPVAFNRDIRPILADRCFACHGPDSAHRKAELRLDVRQSATRLVRGIRPISPADPDGSELLRRISSADPSMRMPPAQSGKPPLEPEQIQLIKRWIAEGAPYQRHWSFLPPRMPDLPTVADQGWIRNEIDLFILHRLERERVQPSPRADPVTLARRLHFDLLGLPPAVREVDGFADDPSQANYAKMVDRLLASPHFGERMAVYWLDLVRYADTVGYHGDQDHAISPYRDYVISAFNNNMPFDQFTREQIAGDLLPDRTTDQLIASGYNRLLQTSHEGGVQQKEYLTKYSADRVRNVSSVWMGATLGCAECHNHKYDPYTQKDFYAMAAFFADVNDLLSFRGTNSLPTKREPEIKVFSPLDRIRFDELQRRRDQLLRQLAENPNEPAIATAIATLEKELQVIEGRKLRTMVTQSIEPREIRLLRRGDWMDLGGAVVQPAAPEFLNALPPRGRRANRLDLVDWLVDPEHPLTARVFVNRVWYLFFGSGISRSLDDNGAQGDWPSHPALLDYLAVRFVRSGWNVKELVKTLVLSNAYQQSSQVAEDQRSLDPENRLFARQARFRLPAESVRDNALAVSGLLFTQPGGKPARPYQPAGYYKPLNFPKRTYTADTGFNQYRRGVYTHWQRQFLHPMLRALDAPSREECTVQRPASNTPLAALTLLNDPTFVETARVYAERIIQAAAADPLRMEWAWKTALSRAPTAAEQAVLMGLLQRNRRYYAEHHSEAEAVLKVGNRKAAGDIPVAELAAWTGVARAIFNLNEMITRN